jgi:hypothetical protein
MGDATPEAQTAAVLVGGMITGGTHFLKSSGRAAINASPEPFSNWTASFGEDGRVLGGLFLAIRHPAVFLLALVLFLALVAWLLPKLIRFLSAVARRLSGRARTNAQG